MLQALYGQLVTRLPPKSWAAREAVYLELLTRWIAGDTKTANAADLARVAMTPAQQEFFRRGPDRSLFQVSDGPAMHYERTGYPVLMRNLDLAPPV